VTENHTASETNEQTVASALLFSAKTRVLQLRRLFSDTVSGACKRHEKGDVYAGNDILAESISQIWTDTDPYEKKLQLGKAQNLRQALRSLNGVEVPADATFSFWKQVGAASTWKGYVPGRELRQGCIIPTVGGGLCQLSNALYDAALTAGFEILERHAHSEVIPGSLAEENRDATIFWNYVDLRFRSQNPFRIEALMDSRSLTLRFRGPVKTQRKLFQIIQTVDEGVNQSHDHQLNDHHGPNSCFSCGVTDCFRNVKPSQTKIESRNAYLLDELWPEFDNYIQSERGKDDLLFLPINGKDFGKQNYAWSTNGFSRVHSAPLQTILRSYESRKLARQGADRQKALLKHQSKLATAYGAQLKFDVTHLVVMQGLLPFLWLDGTLGGRTFDVLMTQLPMQKLHERLNFAHMLHMESPTLADFRADDRLLKAETEALRSANKIITPHSEIAEIFPDKTAVLDWQMPNLAAATTMMSGATTMSSGARNTAAGGNVAGKVLFPASTLGRKGAYELREVARSLSITVVLAGAELEGDGFWNGVNTQTADNADLFRDVDAVVLPAFVEHRPRRLLEAVCRGLPVIASEACGLANVDGVTSIQTGDVDALKAALADLSGLALEKQLFI